MAPRQARRFWQAADRSPESTADAQLRDAPWLLLEQFAYCGHDPAQEEPVFRAVVRNDGPVDAVRTRLVIWRRFDRGSQYASRERVVPSGGKAQFEVLIPQEWTHDSGQALNWTVRARIADEASGAACEVWPR